MIAKEDADIKSKYTGSNESEILSTAKEKYQSLQRDEMEAVEQAALKAQDKKKTAVTVVPSKTMPFAQRAAASKEEVIARVRARLGPPEATV